MVCLVSILVHVRVILVHQTGGGTTCCLPDQQFPTGSYYSQSPCDRIYGCTNKLSKPIETYTSPGAHEPQQGGYAQGSYALLTNP